MVIVIVSPIFKAMMPLYLMILWCFLNGRCGPTTVVFMVLRSSQALDSLARSKTSS